MIPQLFAEIRFESLAPQQRSQPAESAVAGSRTSEFFSTLGVAPLLGRARFYAPHGGRVGVVGTVKQTGLGDESPEAFYTPLTQAPRSFLLVAMTFVVRTSLDPAAVAPVLRREIQALDPNLPVDRITTLSDLLADSVSEPRFRTVVVGAFAGVALALVATGIMGVLAYLVTQRTREIGLRMALGADGVQVVRLVLRQTFVMSLAGVVLGLAAASALTQLLRRYLFDVQPTDPMTFAGAAALLVGVALVASYVPARRATNVDPLVALRSE